MLELLSRDPYPRSFYAADPLQVARQLLGALLVHNSNEGLLAGRVVETEAYRGQADLACHASAGRTKRSETLFGPPGYAYVYLIYGMYHLLNAVSWPDGRPAAVLIRGLEPVVGIDRTTDGPGKLTRALGVDLRHNRVDLSSTSLFFTPDRTFEEEDIEASPRIGVDYAGEWAKKPWRFAVRGNPHVSKRRPAPASKRHRGRVTPQLCKG